MRRANSYGSNNKKRDQSRELDESTAGSQLSSGSRRQYKSSSSGSRRARQRQQQNNRRLVASGSGGGDVDLGSLDSSGQPRKVPIQINLPFNWLQILYYNIIGKFLFESDTFEELLRKFIIVPFLGGTVGGAGPAVYWVIMFTRERYVADLLNAIAIFAMGIGLTFVYFKMRAGNGEPVSNSLLWVIHLLAAMIATSLQMGAATVFPTALTSFALICCGMMCNLPHIWVLVSWFAAMFYVNTQVQAYRDVPGAFVLHLPTRNAAGLETVIVYIAISIPMYLVAIALYFSFKEQRRQVGAAKKSVEIAQAIVYELRKYNTDKVQEIVDATLEGDDQDVNKELLVSFGAMVDNLEKYRPFLPNYLFLTSSGEEDEDEDDEGTLALGDETTINSTNSRNNHRGGGNGNHPPRRSAMMRGEDDEGSIASYSSSHTTNTTAMGSSLHSGGLQSLTSSSPQQQQSSNGASTFRGVMTMALIDVQSNAWFSANLRGGCSKATAQSNTLRFSEAVFEAARVSKASVHSMVGDTIQLSWNATHRVAQPETKAAQLLLQLQRSVQEQTGFRIAGAACSGVAETHSVFSQKAKQFALHVDAAWLPALQQLFALACEHRTVLVDSNTKDPASYNVLAQAVDCVRYMPRVSRGPVEGGLVSGVEDSALCTVPVGAKSMPGLKPLPFVCGGTSAADDTSKTQQQQPQPSLAVDLASKSYARLMTSAILCNATVGGNTVHQEPLIAPANSDAWRYTLVYELTSVLQHDEDEWMYQLKAQEAGGGDGGEEKVEEAISAVLHLSLEGRYGEALEYAEQQINNRKKLLSDPSSSSLFSRLVTALQAAALMDSSGGIASSGNNVAVSQK